MIRFDPSSIFNRSLQKLQQDPNWRVIANNSVISALLKSNAEINAETARYAEYLFKESKWDTAQNESSILSMANLLGYQPKRKISAKGTIKISADPRTHLVGKSISSYTFEHIGSSSLNWNTLNRDLSITGDCTITDSKGNSYVPTRALFPANTLTMDLEIVQGKRKSAFIDINTIRSTSTQSKLDPYLYIPIKIEDCEDASSITSKAYFKVYIVSAQNNVTNYLEYRVVDSLLLSSTSDYDVEVYNDMYSRNLFYLKFNNDPNRGNTLDISQNSSITGIRIDYIESLGADGNLLDLFENFTISDLIISESGSLSGNKLYGVNLGIITGGKDEETIIDIKANAPKFYITNYTAGTKEAYENAVANMEFSIKNFPKPIKPRKVQVYGDKREDENGNILPVTCISFIADGMDDLITDSSLEDPYSDIEEALNYYLTRLKSPQDSLRFVPPNYISFAIGLKCRVNKEEVDDIYQLESDIRTIIDNSWGSNSDDIDFGRNFYSSGIVTEIMNTFPEIVSISTEVEAIKKLDWDDAIRVSPKSDEDASSTIIHTMRIPFNFDPLFLGEQSVKGFKDYRTGSDYVMRIDFMYKKPKSMGGSNNYHTTIFIKDNKADRTYQTTTAFYLIKDTSQNGIWMMQTSGGEEPWSLAPTDYSSLVGISQLKESEQYYFRDEVYNDNDYRALLDESSSDYISTISTYLSDPGAIDDYLVYFSGNYDDDAETIGDGWIELTFDPIYKMLTTFATYDVDLKNTLRDCPLALLKCNNTDMTNTFKTFTDALNEYVDVYVSMRPIDGDFFINNSSSSSGSSLLYIDSFDNVSVNGTIDLTNSKRQRMISVQCEYEV